MAQRNAYKNTTGMKGSISQTLAYNPKTEWVRNPCWLAMPTFTDGEQKICGLWAVYDHPLNYVSFSAAGNYTVDWGDGTTNNYSTGTTCTHTYTYSDTHLDGTDRPVTFTVSTDVVTRTAHGLANNDQVLFFNLVSTTGINEGTVYYVRDADANSFKIADAPGGTAIDLTGSDGSATLLSHKQALITITPQAGQNLTSINFQSNTPPSGVTASNTYGSSWLDLVLSGNNFTSFTFSSASGYRHWLVQRVLFLMPTITMTNWANAFYVCEALRTVPTLPVPTASGAVSLNSVFYYCQRLLAAPVMNTSAVTNMGSSFISCMSLHTVPKWSLASVTTMSGAFQNCWSLRSLPAMDLSAATDCSNMLNDCRSLATIGAITTTTALTNCASMFYGCLNLREVPLFTTSAVTNVSSMFSYCMNLWRIPKFNFTAATTVTSCFTACTNLNGLPAVQFSSAVTNLSSVFSQPAPSEGGPQVLPSWSTSNVTNMSSIFLSNNRLETIPAWNVSAVTTVGQPTNLYRLTRSRWTGLKVSHSYSACALAKTQLEEVFTNLGTPATSQTITVTSNPGVDTAVTKASSGTTSGSTTVTMADTTNLSTGMLVTGTGISDAVAVTFQDTGDTVTLTAHGLSNGMIVSFATIVTTTGISVYTRYYVVGAATDTFQLSLTNGGAAIALTTDGSGTMLYGSYIQTINTNTSIVLDKPASATGTVTVTARKLDSSIATMKRWAVTF